MALGDPMKLVKDLGKRLDKLEKASKSGGKQVSTATLTRMILLEARKQSAQDMKQARDAAAKAHQEAIGAKRSAAEERKKRDAQERDRARQAAQFGVNLKQLQTEATKLQQRTMNEVQKVAKVNSELQSQLQKMLTRLTQAEKTMSAVQKKMNQLEKKIIENMR